MDTIGEFFGILAEVVIRVIPSVPIEMWKGADDSFWMSAFAIFFGIMIYGMYIVVAVVVIFGIQRLLNRLYETYVFHRDAVPCQHHECGRQRTLGVSTAGHPGCIEGEPCCSDCESRHEADALQRRADNEPKRHCQHNREHGQMAKVIIADFIIDKCATCGSVWLDCDELEKMEQMAYDNGYSAGRSSASSTATTNLAVGIAIGSSF